MFMRAILLLACLLVSACASDTGVLFIGDSLTLYPIGCEYPAQLERRHPPGRVLAYNVAAMGTDTAWWLSKGKIDEKMAAHRIDVVVIALGSNDVRHGRSFEGIVDDIVELRRRVAATSDARGRRPRVLLATIPPQYNPPERDQAGRRNPPNDAAPIRTQIVAANTLLRTRVPGDQIVDFDSWMPAEWDAAVMDRPWDGVHIGCGGHGRRAEAVDRVLGIW